MDEDNTATRLDLTKVDPDAGPPPAAPTTPWPASTTTRPPAAGDQPASVPGGVARWLPPDVFVRLVGNKPFIACACGWLVVSGDVVENNNAHSDHDCPLNEDVPDPPHPAAPPMSLAEAIMRGFAVLVLVAGAVVMAYFFLTG